MLDRLTYTKSKPKKYVGHVHCIPGLCSASRMLSPFTPSSISSASPETEIYSSVAAGFGFSVLHGAMFNQKVAKISEPLRP